MISPWRALRSLDDAWLALLGDVGGQLARSPDCFVAWLGDSRTLLVADEPDLDDDDTLAQIILHELCHHLVEGPESVDLDDWGLNNMTDDDLANEHAALRLQAAILHRPVLRRYLQPTTNHRWFYEGLGSDPLREAQHPETDAASIRLASAGWERWTRWVHRPALQALLVESEACASRAFSR